MADEIRFTDTSTGVGEENKSESGKLGDKAWYVVNTYSTHERKVADNTED